ncbi:hypothetical protein [Streptacidiphilus neutrinimicus]|nr:hypothetical protein [Streptacidiphilus neutrinimicus]
MAGELAPELGCVVAVVGAEIGVAAVVGGALGVVRGAAGRTETR